MAGRLPQRSWRSTSASRQAVGGRLVGGAGRLGTGRWSDVVARVGVEAGCDCPWTAGRCRPRRPSGRTEPVDRHSVPASASRQADWPVEGW